MCVFVTIRAVKMMRAWSNQLQTSRDQHCACVGTLPYYLPYFVGCSVAVYKWYRFIETDLNIYHPTY